MVPSTRAYSKSGSSDRPAKTREDAAPHPATKALEDAVPVAEPARQIAPGHARPHTPQHRLKEQPIVPGRRPRIGCLAGQQRGDLLPSRVAHHKPRPLKHCPNPTKTEREAQPVSRGNPQCQQALVRTQYRSADHGRSPSRPMTSASFARSERTAWLDGLVAGLRAA